MNRIRATRPVGVAIASALLAATMLGGCDRAKPPNAPENPPGTPTPSTTPTPSPGMPPASAASQ
ncbi:hypothetical protein [Caldimonas sp. KR1-144]|uniref:hypothetical protein n=1 Tax=Caldimonas sp. KR1-144 TaxID=3400911 RepID=UPI003BFCA350